MKSAIQKTIDATGAVIGNEIFDKITKNSKTSQYNNLETVKNKHDKKIGKYTSRRKTENYWWSQINVIV